MTECPLCPSETIRCAHFAEETVWMEMQNEQWIIQHKPNHVTSGWLIIGDSDLSHAEEVWDQEVEIMLQSPA